MFAPTNQTHFALTIEGLENDLQVFSLQGREAISQPFVFENNTRSTFTTLSSPGGGGYNSELKAKERHTAYADRKVRTRNAPFCEECETCKAGACAI